MAYLRTSSTCSRVTPGNYDRKSETVAPPSRFSKSATTGTRVPRKTHGRSPFPNPARRWGIKTNPSRLYCIAILLFVLDIYVKYKVLLIWQIIHWCASRLVSAETHAVLSLCRLGRLCLLQLPLADCSLMPMLHSLD
jgi:hypothetical protein